MQIAIGAISHETNTFSRVLTSLQDFEQYQYFRGDDIFEFYRDTSTPIGGFIRAAKQHDVILLPTTAAYAVPSGPVTADALVALSNQLCEDLERLLPDINGVLLDLHGAMVSEAASDAEGYILERVREVVGNDLPVAVVLDSHMNLTPKMVEIATILIGYDTYPHVDMHDKGGEALRLLLETISGTLRPQKALVQLPLLATLPGQYTGRSPMREIMARANELEQEPGVLNITVAAGFPYADIPEAGFAILTTTNGDASLADRLADEMATLVWNHRGELVRHGINVEQAVHEAMAAEEGPIVLADLGDNPGGGSPCDGTGLLWALLDLGVRNAALAIITDPEAVDKAVSAGIGQTVQLTLGAKVDRLHGYPIDVTAKVENITDGKFKLEGPMAAGMTINLGRTVVLRAEARHGGDVQVIVSERRKQPFDMNFFRSQGIEPREKKILAVKSAVHFRAAYEPIAAEVIDVSTPGLTTPDFGFFEYRNVRRPIYPLDPNTTIED